VNKQIPSDLIMVWIYETPDGEIVYDSTENLMEMLHDEIGANSLAGDDITLTVKVRVMPRDKYDALEEAED
jgi:hypothetical protein